MSIDAFLETAWAEHAERPREVADRLAASLHLLQAVEDLPPFVRIATHVYGEHLGQWEEGVGLLEAMRGLPSPVASDSGNALLTRAIATLRFAGGDAASLQSLGTEDRVSALAVAASALAGRGDTERAIAAFADALDIGRAGLPARSPAIRALAVGGNNLAATLEGKPDRAASETRAMVGAAEAGLTYWTQAGTWLEVERAEYRLARSLLQAGEPNSAIAHAMRCAAICDEHDALPLERFSAHAVLALAHRAAGNVGLFEVHRQIALACFEHVIDANKGLCKADLDELDDRA